VIKIVGKSFAGEMKDILGKEPSERGPTNSYLNDIRTAYSDYRNSQARTAINKASKKTPVNAAMQSVASLMFTERHLGSILDIPSDLKNPESFGDLAERAKSTLGGHYSTPKLEEAIAVYGREKKLSAVNAVESAEARLYAIEQVYGGLDQYKGHVKDEISTWNDRFSGIENIAQNPIVNTAQGLFAVLAAHNHKNDATREIADTVQRFGSIMREHADDIGTYGQSLVGEYAKLKVKEVREYETLVKAREPKKATKPKKIFRTKESLKTKS